MRLVADGVWQLHTFPADAVNVYLVGDVLIDAATRWATGGILRALRGRTVRVVALTHCHPDHQGAARAVCRRFGAPLACHEADADAVAGRTPMRPNNWIIRLGRLTLAGPPCSVGRVLRDGDEVGDLRVVHTPGHTPGHVSFFRESDRLLFTGDVLANFNVVTGKPALCEPPRAFSADPALNRRAIQTLVALRPKVVCFGHGPPLFEPSRLEEFAELVKRRRPLETVGS